VQAYLDMRSAEFKRVFDSLNVGYDLFVRTSDAFHMDQVARIEQRLMDAGLIVQKQYHGVYCTGCEQFKKTSDLDPSGRCPDHPSLVPEELDELNYFLRIEPFRQRLIQHIRDNPDFVVPRGFQTQLLNMLSEPLDDLCISRPTRRVTLGVTLPFDDDYVTYVWFDALINYLTNLGWPDPAYKPWWDTVEHLIGKDILKTHGVYWPIMLMALGEAPPRKLSVHGHWVGAGGVKMSKTLGNVVDPVEVVDKFGADALRFYLARHMRSDTDSQISLELIRQTYNAELGNKIGNLFSRAGKFAKSRFDGKIPEPGELTQADRAARQAGLDAANAFARGFEMHELPQVLQQVMAAAERMNDYFTEQAPWELIKQPDSVARCATVIYVTLDTLRLLFEGLRQICPTAADDALSALDALPIAPEGTGWAPAVDRLRGGQRLGEIATLFPRVPEDAI
jgi:methionyl-tRNA synthetase